MKKKMNNKGFSLVELIVVIAIMAILAVTLAPRLTQYIDKARQANDREAVNAVYTAIKLGMLDDGIYATPLAGITASTDTPPYYELELNGSTLYTVVGKVWTASDPTDLFLKEITDTLGSFKLQSNSAGDDTEIVVTVYSQTLFKVQLDYDGDGTFEYTVDSANVAVD